MMHQPLALFLLQAEPAVDLFANVTPLSIAEVLAVLILTSIVIRYASRLLHVFGARSPQARFAIRWFEPVMRIGLWFTAVLFSFQRLTPSTDTFRAGLGSAAIAIGLGAQDLIRNFVGGLVVLADRPYQLGDRVKIGDAYGEIDHIGLRSTKLTTPDDTRVTIPNSQILSDRVFNSNSGVPDAQTVTDVYLPPEANADLARRVGYEAAYTSPYLHTDKPVVVLVQSGFDQRPYLRVRIKAYVHDHRHEPRMMSDITARALEEYRRRGMLGWSGGSQHEG